MKYITVVPPVLIKYKYLKTSLQYSEQEPVTCQSSSLSPALSLWQSAWRRSDEDERREKLASVVRAAERRLVRRAGAELHGAPRGHPGAVTRVERQRLDCGCAPARGAPASCLDRTNGEFLYCLLWKKNEIPNSTEKKQFPMKERNVIFKRQSFIRHTFISPSSKEEVSSFIQIWQETWWNNSSLDLKEFFFKKLPRLFKNAEFSSQSYWFELILILCCIGYILLTVSKWIFYTYFFDKVLCAVWHIKVIFSVQLLIRSDSTIRLWATYWSMRLMIKNKTITAASDDYFHEYNIYIIKSFSQIYLKKC